MPALQLPTIFIVFQSVGTLVNGYSENGTRTDVALTPVRPRSVCKVRLHGLPGSASFRRLRNRSARLQPPRDPARRPGTGLRNAAVSAARAGKMPALRCNPIFIAFQGVGNPHERLL